MRKLDVARPIQPSLSYSIQQAAERGLALADLLAGSGLTNTSYQDPKVLVSTRQTLRIYRNMLRLSRLPTLGLELGRSVGPNSVGMLGALVSNASDLGHAAYLLRRFNALSNPWITSELIGELQPGKVVVRYRQHFKLDALYRFLIDRDLRGTQALLVHIFGIRAARFLSRIDFGYPQPREARRYAAEFGCPVNFDRDATYVTFDSGLSSLTNGHRTGIAYNTYLSLCSDAMARTLQATWSRQVLNTLSSSDEYPSAREMADKLACSERSLRRHLKAEGYQYSELLDRVRFDRAAYLLTHSRDSVKEIGYKLQYSEAANFIHAFVRWAGTSPAAYRREGAKYARN